MGRELLLDLSLANGVSLRHVIWRVAGIVDDAQTLIKQQFAMLRAEVKEDINKATQAGKLLGIGIACATIGTLFGSTSTVRP